MIFGVERLACAHAITWADPALQIGPGAERLPRSREDDASDLIAFRLDDVERNWAKIQEQTK